MSCVCIPRSHLLIFELFARYGARFEQDFCARWREALAGILREMARSFGGTFARDGARLEQDFCARWREALAGILREIVQSLSRLLVRGF